MISVYCLLTRGQIFVALKWLWRHSFGERNLLETFCLGCTKVILGGSKFPSSEIPWGNFRLCVRHDITIFMAGHYNPFFLQRSDDWGQWTRPGTWEENKTAWVGRIRERSGGAEIRRDRKEDRSVRVKQAGDLQNQDKWARGGRPHGEHMWCWVMKNGE